MFMSDIKVIVYSANIGGYDNFIPLTNYDPNVRYILFTDDNDFKSDVWEVKSVDFLNDKLDNRKKARYIKMNPHLVLPPHDISIWVDHCLEPKFTDVNELLKEINFGNSSVMCFPHPERDCIYDEGQVVLILKLDYPEIVNKQMNKYHSMSFRTHRQISYDLVFAAVQQHQIIRMVPRRMHWYTPFPTTR